MLQQAFQGAHELAESDSGRELLDKILEELDQIDPELASTLTSQIDDVVRRYSVQEMARTRELRNNPIAITDQADQDELQERTAGAARLLVEAMWCGRASTLSRQASLEWLHIAADAEFLDALAIVGAVTESARRSGRTQEHLKFAQAIRRGAGMVASVAAVFGDNPSASAQSALTIVPAGLTLYHVGERERALKEVTDWIQENASEWLVISDPYFTIREVGLLRDVPTGVRIRILTSVESQRGIRGESRPSAADLPSIYAAAWKERVYTKPPPTEIVVLGGAKSGRSPLHDRYLLADHGGLRLGTSISGLGSRESEMTRLTADEVQDVLVGTIQRWTSFPMPPFEGEDLVLHAFPLSDTP